MDFADIGDFAQYAINFPIVGLVVWIVFKFIGVMKEQRQDFVKELAAERASREEHTDKLDTTLTGLNGSVKDLDRTVTELRSDVHRAGQA